MHGAIKRTIGTALGTAAVAALALPAGVDAAEFEITSLDDAGPGSLRAAIEAANEHQDTSSAIAFNEGLDGAIALETPLPGLVKVLEIAGPGADRLAITRNPEADDFRIFTAGSGSRVAISGVTISGGRAGVVDLPGELFGDVVAGGGLLVAEGAELTLQDAVIRDNAASSSGTPSTAIGGGIASLGSLTIEASAIFDNLVETTGPASASSATGGGIASLGSGIGDVWDSTLSLRLTTVSGKSRPSGHASARQRGRRRYRRARRERDDDRERDDRRQRGRGEQPDQRQPLLHRSVQDGQRSQHHIRRPRGVAELLPRS